MVKASSDYGHKSIKPLLVRVGLNQKEAEIYLALLSLKTAGASEVAKLAGQSRSHTYLILRDLEKRGLVSEGKDRGLLQFIAEPPERLISYLKDQEEKYRELQKLVEGAMPVLSSLTRQYVGAPRITILKGMEGMKQVYRDILTQKYVGIYNAQTSLEVFGDNIVTMLFGKEAKLKGRDLLVHNEGAKQYLKFLPPGPDYAVRLLPTGILFETDTIVYGDNVTLFSFDDERTIIRIENRKIADAFRAWFEVMWQISEKV
jgi:HTH-type transcriptional regulator, sugar sensing transcriptional regulator